MQQLADMKETLMRLAGLSPNDGTDTLPLDFFKPGPVPGSLIFTSPIEPEIKKGPSETEIIDKINHNFNKLRNIFPNRDSKIKVQGKSQR